MPRNVGEQIQGISCGRGGSLLGIMNINGLWARELAELLRRMEFGICITIESHSTKDEIENLRSRYFAVKAISVA